MVNIKHFCPLWHIGLPSTHSSSALFCFALLSFFNVSECITFDQDPITVYNFTYGLSGLPFSLNGKQLYGVFTTESFIGDEHDEVSYIQRSICVDAMARWSERRNVDDVTAGSGLLHFPSGTYVYGHWTDTINQLVDVSDVWFVQSHFFVVESATFSIDCWDYLSHDYPLSRVDTNYVGFTGYVHNVLVSGCSEVILVIIFLLATFAFTRLMLFLIPYFCWMIGLLLTFLSSLSVYVFAFWLLRSGLQHLGVPTTHLSWYAVCGLIVIARPTLLLPYLLLITFSVVPTALAYGVTFDVSSGFNVFFALDLALVVLTFAFVLYLYKRQFDPSFELPSLAPDSDLERVLDHFSYMPSSDPLWLAVLNLSVFRLKYCTTVRSVVLFRAFLLLKTRYVAVWPTSLNGQVRNIKFSHRGSALTLTRKTYRCTQTTTLRISEPFRRSTLFSMVPKMELYARSVPLIHLEQELFVIQDVALNISFNLSYVGHVPTTDSFDYTPMLINDDDVIARLIDLKDGRYLEVAYVNDVISYHIPWASAVSAILRYNMATHPNYGIISTALPNTPREAVSLVMKLATNAKFAKCWRDMGVPDTSFLILYSGEDPSEYKKMNVVSVCNAVYTGQGFGYGVPVKSKSTEKDTFKRRIDAPKVNFLDFDFVEQGTPELYLYAKEFVSFLTPSEPLVLCDDSEVRAQMNKPSQRLNRSMVETVLDYLPKGPKSIFTKNEPVEIGKPARNIVTMSPQRLYQAAHFTIPASRHLQNFPWWVWGVGGGATSTKYHQTCSNYDKMIESDFSKFDASLSQFFVAFNSYMMYKLFGAELHKQWQLLEADVLHQIGVTRLGNAFFLGHGRLSGCNETTLFNTVDQAFIQYVAIRRVTKNAVSAWDVVLKSLYGGDDGITPYIGQDLVAASRDFGMVVDVRVFDSNTPCRFLGRIYPNGRDSRDSYHDICAFLKTMHLVSLGSLNSAEQGLVNVANGLAVTDYNTPLLRSFIRSVWKAYPDYRVIGTSYSSTRSDSQPLPTDMFLDADRWWVERYDTSDPFVLENNDSSAIYSYVAKQLGVEVESLTTLESWFDNNPFYVNETLPILPSIMPELISPPKQAVCLHGMPIGEPGKSPDDDIQRGLDNNNYAYKIEQRRVVDIIKGNIAEPSQPVSVSAALAGLVATPMPLETSDMFHQAVGSHVSEVSHFPVAHANRPPSVVPELPSGLAEDIAGMGLGESLLAPLTTCHYCKLSGHSVDVCPKLASTTCKRCRTKGHTAAKCTVIEEKRATELLSTTQSGAHLSGVPPHKTKPIRK